MPAASTAGSSSSRMCSTARTSPSPTSEPHAGRTRSATARLCAPGRDLFSSSLLLIASPLLSTPPFRKGPHDVTRSSPLRPDRYRTHRPGARREHRRRPRRAAHPRRRPVRRRRPPRRGRLRRHGDRYAGRRVHRRRHRRDPDRLADPDARRSDRAGHRGRHPGAVREADRPRHRQGRGAAPAGRVVRCAGCARFQPPLRPRVRRCQGSRRRGRDRCSRTADDHQPRPVGAPADYVGVSGGSSAT